MPRNGYWIECVPVHTVTNTLDISDDVSDHLDGGNQYKAIISSIPDLNVVAQSPDQAIDRLRKKLLDLKRNSQMDGRVLPEGDNPVRPPKNLRSVQGWISVYLQFTEQCSNH